MNKKKIIVEIAEGLGNQLFMYAHAYSLSKILNYNLYIDDSSGFSSKKTQLRKHQKYMLNYFNIRQNIASKNNKYDTIYKYHKKKIEKIIEKFSIKKKFLKEVNIKTNQKKTAIPFKIPPISKLSDLLYVQGNFEDENYFKHLRGDIVNMFKPLDKYINNNIHTVNHLKNTNSVSIHIRTNKYTEQPHEMNNQENLIKTDQFTEDLIEYIYKAISFFKKKVNDPVFFIWSNDVESIKHHFSGPNLNFISGNDVINDFNLFTFSKHFIVGCSSFHWWGAWLNENPYKICVCPSKLNPSNNENFYPLNWHRI